MSSMRLDTRNAGAFGHLNQLRTVVMLLSEMDCCDPRSVLDLCELMKMSEPNSANHVAETERARTILTYQHGVRRESQIIRRWLSRSDRRVSVTDIQATARRRGRKLWNRLGNTNDSFDAWLDTCSNRTLYVLAGDAGGVLLLPHTALTRSTVGATLH